MPQLLLPAGAVARGPAPAPEGPGGADTPATATNRSGSQVALPPGLPPSGGMPSAGSALHAAGECRPCAWFWKPGSCENGESCGHCHLCPEGELRARKKAKQAMMRLGLATPSAAAAPEAEAAPCATDASPAGPAAEKATGGGSAGPAAAKLMLPTGALPKAGNEAVPPPGFDPPAPSGWRIDRHTLLRLGLSTPKSYPGSGLKAEVVTSAVIGLRDQLDEPIAKEVEQDSTTASGSEEAETDTATAGPGSERADGDSGSEPGSEKWSRTAEAKGREGLLVPIPPGLEPPPETPSHGSALHKAGNCQPCAWFYKPGSCQNGRDCGYCHLCPEGEVKLRKKTKQTMLRLGLATPKPAAGDEYDAHYRLSFSMPMEESGSKTVRHLKLASLV